MRKVFLILFLASLTYAYSNLPKDAYFNPEVLEINQELYLGKKLKNYTILTDKGWTDLQSVIHKKPTILQLAYYTCDASCPILTENLLKAVKDLSQKDFNVLVLSFDRRDNIKTLEAFKTKLGNVPCSACMLQVRSSQKQVCHRSSRDLCSHGFWTHWYYRSAYINF
jgi:protein SCO1/2